MMGRWLLVLACSALLSGVATAVATTVFQRPINQDCVTPTATVQAQSVDSRQYFPADFLVVGELFQAQNHTTVC